MSGVDIKNNIIYENGQEGMHSSDAHGSGVVFDHNLNYGNGTADYNFTGNGSDYSYTLGTTISADPRFVNDTSASFDPHLGSGSPCIGAGLNLSSTLTTDIQRRGAPGQRSVGPGGVCVRRRQRQHGADYLQHCQSDHHCGQFDRPAGVHGG